MRGRACSLGWGSTFCEVPLSCMEVKGLRDVAGAYILQGRSCEHCIYLDGEQACTDTKTIDV